MSVKYIPVQWNNNKYLYDAVVLGFIALYIGIFLGLGQTHAEFSRPTDGQILRIRAFGSCAFIMLTIILCIGPLARLDKRYLPILYNRRHFGVMTAAVAFTHATYVLGWYYGFIPGNSYAALLGANTSYGQLLGFPIEPLGIFALFVLVTRAATSHDFWLSFLTAPVWKRLHLMIYPAYLSVVLHVALGYLQDAKNPGFALLFAGGAITVGVLHVLAWRHDRVAQAAPGAWRDVGTPDELTLDRGKIIHLSGKERAAIFLYDGNKVSAVSNACAHQNGPLGEGRILDGCITCPWHGFQYRMADGQAPAPFTEKIPTYNIRLHEGRLQIDTNANPPGTHVDPLILPEGAL
jgi:nitrite reductase/ring-hydroxylating ferredoxin subunit/DMSO/TMAO reductase YedYZ heme-binding membrane subunit